MQGFEYCHLLLNLCVCVSFVCKIYQLIKRILLRKLKKYPDSWYHEKIVDWKCQSFAKENVKSERCLLLVWDTSWPQTWGHSEMQFRFCKQTNNTHNKHRQFEQTIKTRAECARKVRELIPILILKNDLKQWKIHQGTLGMSDPLKLDFYQWTTKTKPTRQTMNNDEKTKQWITLKYIIIPWSRSLIPGKTMKNHLRCISTFGASPH